MASQPIRRALLSVSDKTGLVELAKALREMNVELVSTGGTYRALSEASLEVREISDLTGFPEMLDGRVKTLHPHVHGGILALRDNEQHQQALQQAGIEPIDLVVCNLYPFEQTLAKEDSTHQDIIENIDIGGPTMVRAAAKNYQHVAILTNPTQYNAFLTELREAGEVSEATRYKLAADAFARIADYDRAIGDYFAIQAEIESDSPFRSTIALNYNLKSKLRYGENPHQKGAFYVEDYVPPVSLANAEVLNGKELSFNNLLDLDSALRLVREFTDPAVVVLKHNNPCGAALGNSLEEAFENAWAGDPISAFGSILGFNREIDEATAKLITAKGFVECIIAPGYSESALQVLTTPPPKWTKTVRLLKTGKMTSTELGWDYRRVEGGMLVQTTDVGTDELDDLKVISERAPTENEMRDLRFGWLVCKHVKSNAIVLAKDRMIVGVGAGQMSRIDSTDIAKKKAGDRKSGAVLASDAFFPFRDNVDAAAEAGITAIIQPGGSKGDDDSIKAANEHGIAMVFTGVRHFRH